jgi:hypothetical protein
MNSYIIINLKNFTFAHEIYVFNEENEVLTKTQCSMGNLAETVAEYSNLYRANKVKIMGKNAFSKKLGQEITQTSLAKYELKIDVEYI